MNFSNTSKLRKLLSLILAMLLLIAMFAGCQKDDDADSSSTPSEPNIKLEDKNPTDESQTQTTESQPAVVNENMATVTGTLNIRSTPSTEALVVGTLYAGDKVEIIRRETVVGYEWGYITEPAPGGWIVMDYVEMDYVPEETTGDGDSTPDETTPAETKPDDGSTGTSAQNIKGVVSVKELNIRSEASADSDRVGSYVKGDVVTILETKNDWGRTNKGWVKMEYVNTTGTTTNNTANNSTNNNTNNSNTNNSTTGNGSTTVIAKGIVTVKELNIRSKASTDGERVGALSYGDRVEILEKSGNWGRTSKGWISLDYVYQDGTTGSKTAKGIVTGTQLNVRSGPGTNYGSVGTLNSGDRVNILEQFTYNGTTWGCTKSGWVCLDYIYIDGTDAGQTKTGTITGNGLNIRSGPGTGYDAVGSLNSGDTVKVLYQLKVGDTTWGCIDKGWISMTYVDLD